MTEKTQEQLDAEAAKAAQKQAEKEAREKAKRVKAEAAAQAKAERETAAAEKKAAKEAEREAKKAAAEQAKADRIQAREDARIAKEQAKQDAIAAREANRQPEQNGVRRPGPDGKCGRVWALADKLSGEIQQPVAIAPLLAAGEAEGLNTSNIRTEYARWKKFHGISGRVAPVATEAAAQ